MIVTMPGMGNPSCVYDTAREHAYCSLLLRPELPEFSGSGTALRLNLQARQVAEAAARASGRDRYPHGFGTSNRRAGVKQSDQV